VTKLQQKLTERIRQLGLDIPDDVDYRRLYPGHWQRAAGAWSWCAFNANGREIMGSPHPISELVKADSIEVMEHGVDAFELFPVFDDDKPRTD
jgi:hypothetical protein